MRALTLGTAGHIDHGKTTLVKALTGRDTDRLKEEKDRGISIELGFAELLLPSGRRLSVVDVPGHERFVRTMVAGATGIDLFLLVVAADDGVMPQTREHVRIIELLGIPNGVVALTKIDAVTPDLVELVKAEIEDFLGSTRYVDAPIVEVSGVTGDGLPQLVQALDAVAGNVAARTSFPVTRMPIDRVFSLKGIGTVVTGTLWSGEIRVDETVTLLPRSGGRNPESARVRSIEVHDREVTSAVAGQRAALSLVGVDRGQIARGQWVVEQPPVRPTYLADVRLNLLEDASAMPPTFRGRIDHGTAELLAKVVLTQREPLKPGESTYAQVRFEEEALVFPGDQFILRSVTPATTIGGGTVLDPAPRKHGSGGQWQHRLDLLERGSAEAIVELRLEDAFPRGTEVRRLEASPYLWRFPRGEIRAATGRLMSDGRAVAAGAPGESAGAPLAPGLVLFHAPMLAALADSARDILRGRAESDPLNPYVTLGDLRRSLFRGQEFPALDEAVRRLEADGEVARSEHGWRSAGGEAGFGPGEQHAVQSLMAQFERQEIPLWAETPNVPDAAVAAGLAKDEAQRIVDALVRQGRLAKVGEDLFYPPERLSELMRRLETAMEQSGQLTLAEARDLLGTSRRYAQALLEHMDSEGMTLRVGDYRRLRRRRR